VYVCGAADSPTVTLIVNGQRLTTTERALLSVPGSYFEAMLRQRDNFATDSDGAFKMDGSVEHSRVILSFMDGFGSVRPLDSDFYQMKISKRACVALGEQVEFLLLPPLAWLLKARKLNSDLLALPDRIEREKEDTMRWLIAVQQAARPPGPAGSSYWPP
jgi:hypothetical protein